MNSKVELYEVHSIAAILRENSPLVENKDRLGTAMGIQQADLDDIYAVVHRDRLSNHGFFYVLLNKWIDMNGQVATMGGLVTILREEQFNSTADKIENIDPEVRATWRTADPKYNLLRNKWWPLRKDLNATFIPRESKDGVPFIKEMQEILESSGHTSDHKCYRKVVVAGLGGIGKSTLAIWFAREYETNYDHVIWISSDAPELRDSLCALATELSLNKDSRGIIADIFRAFMPSESLEVLCSRIYEQISSMNKKCLFIFDNVVSYGGENGIKSCLPQHPLFDCIITSRSQDWTTSQNCEIPILRPGMFTPSAAMTFLRNELHPTKSEQVSNSVLEELAIEIGYLPLALQYAVAAINKHETLTVEKYTKQIRKNNYTHLAHDTGVGDYDLSILKTFEVTLTQIEGHDNNSNNPIKVLALTILRICAYCHPNAIPLEMFQTLLKVSDEIECEIEYATRLLCEYSLIDTFTQNGKQFLNIHRLLQQVMKYRQSGKISEVETLKFAINCGNSLPECYNGTKESIWASVELNSRKYTVCYRFPLRLLVVIGTLFSDQIFKMQTQHVSWMTNWMLSWTLYGQFTISINFWASLYLFEDVATFHSCVSNLPDEINTAAIAVLLCILLILIVSNLASIFSIDLRCARFLNLNFNYPALIFSLLLSVFLLNGWAVIIIMESVSRGICSSNYATISNFGIVIPVIVTVPLLFFLTLTSNVGTGSINSFLKKSVTRLLLQSNHYILIIVPFCVVLICITVLYYTTNTFIINNQTLLVFMLETYTFLPLLSGLR